MELPRFWPLYLLVAGGFVHGWMTAPPMAVNPAPGVLVKEQPVQRDLSDERVQRLDEQHNLTLLAEYRIRARVLSRADYNWDAGADLSPMDLALGWGRMSDSAIVDQIDIKQSVRYATWRSNEFPIPLIEISRSIANTHLIPANSEVLKQMRRIGRGQVVELSGYLVDARADDGFRWRSSMKRSDTGNGACELMLVESVSWF